MYRIYVYVSVCRRMYLYVSYVSVGIVCICMYLCFICMYGLDFQSTLCQVPKKQPGEAGPAGLDSVHPWACAHIILPVF